MLSTLALPTFSLPSPTHKVAAHKNDFTSVAAHPRRSLVHTKRAIDDTPSTSNTANTSPNTPASPSIQISPSQYSPPNSKWIYQFGPASKNPQAQFSSLLTNLINTIETTKTLDAQAPQHIAEEVPIPQGVQAPQMEFLLQITNQVVFTWADVIEALQELRAFSGSPMNKDWVDVFSKAEPEMRAAVVVFDTLSE